MIVMLTLVIVQQKGDNGNYSSRQDGEDFNENGSQTGELSFTFCTIRERE